ncbi:MULTISPECIES: methyl-accepting chemotaxis protein [unclassified Undibacterium]|uniref:methyl-accepting chemotaxis protein n=1 Tax=unclassified Undibacterium TaxID=2630295 RepID=UPI002AC9819F|nr:MULTISPECIES: methyl-accepting chemotaxis protein [unclassified Undibacterium]MEB0140892.1 methyl-accepting chemotaxis protein [Undibacterium sp. CCC2.1]MEB0173861.1 methyl-accepting chemotaxis protein [Undibacterium sp. CCC1.1]MEB0177853.1 methyl-accepting chemotaxis protein [Undibacterium sp. CCC3.4]MEB0217074.1 methyl-accepting chemotaxis protein [Undibacterium sp. 5I2]WPX45501.1 methyl-accepting chemotaxis protein [Undibacterium sp. CCC3.4]
MKFSHLKIAPRLYFGFGAVIALLIVLVIIACTNLAKTNEANQRNIHTYQVLDEVSSILESLINIETGQRGFSLSGKPASLEPYKQGKLSLRQHLDKAKALTADNAEQQLRLQQLDQNQQSWISSAIDPAIQLRTDSSDSQMEGVVADEQLGKGKQGMDAMRGLISSIAAAEQTLLTQREASAATLQAQTQWTLIGGGITTAALAMLIAFWLARNIVTPIREAVELAKKVAQGDLTVQVMVASTSNETGELLAALRDMNTALVTVVGEVRLGTDTIAAASGQIASGNLELSSRTEAQASALEQTASSMDELTGTVKQNADNARQANVLAMSASEVAIKGGVVVTQVVDTMSSINASSKKISDIIGVIDGIAFQTNILALNAAVEAARAGEQGRGFAVVASEVRNLAQRSASAAKEIKTLIADSVEKVEVGTRLVDQAGTTMNQIVDSVRHVTDIMVEITAATQEQTSGIDQINQAIIAMDNATQQNAALVEEAAAAAQSLQDQANSLVQVVSVFHLHAADLPAAIALDKRPAAPAKVTTVRRASAVKAAVASTLSSKPRRNATNTPLLAADSGEWHEF